MQKVYAANTPRHSSRLQMYVKYEQIWPTGKMRDLSADVRFQSKRLENRWEAPLLVVQAQLQASTSKGEEIGHRQASGSCQETPER